MTSVLFSVWFRITFLKNVYPPTSMQHTSDHLNKHKNAGNHRNYFAKFESFDFNVWYNQKRGEIMQQFLYFMKMVNINTNNSKWNRNIRWKKNAFLISEVILNPKDTLQIKLMHSVSTFFHIKLPSKVDMYGNEIDKYRSCRVCYYLPPKYDRDFDISTSRFRVSYLYSCIRHANKTCSL